MLPTTTRIDECLMPEAVERCVSWMFSPIVSMQSLDCPPHCGRLTGNANQPRANLVIN